MEWSAFLVTLSQPGKGISMKDFLQWVGLQVCPWEIVLIMFIEVGRPRILWVAPVFTQGVLTLIRAEKSN